MLHHTRVLWEEMRGQSIFITGGTGFFGMWLLESFTRANDALDLGARAVVLSRDPVAFAKKAPHLSERTDLEFIAGDVRTFEFPTGLFSFVIHAATEASFKLNDERPDEMLDAIIAGTKRVLEFSAQARVKKLLLTSSGAVYGRQPSELTHVPEEYLGAPDPLLPSSAYGEGKRVSEHLCVVHAKKHGNEVKIARCFAFVGPHLPLDGHFAIGNFIRDALQGQAIHVGGDGTPMRSYLYAADLAVWLWTILFRSPTERAYNVGSSEAVSIAELANTVREVLSPNTTVQISGLGGPHHPISRYVPSVQRAKSELNLRVLISVPDGVAKTAAWFRTHP